MTATIQYEGNLRCSAIHLQSGSIIETDAPTDNRGKGERFSPTDLVCTALGTCIITTMAMKADDLGINLAGTTIEVTKHMLSDPRRIGQIDVVIKAPAHLNIEEKNRIILQRTGDHCPVARSLHPDLVINAEYHWE